MRRSALTAVIVLSIVALIAGGLPAPADAGNTAANVALGLASFAVFNQLFGGFGYYDWYPPRYRQVHYYVVESPPVVYYTQPVVAIQAPATASVIYYPHGRYELRAYGARSEWVWIPTAPYPPPAAECKPTGKYVKTQSGFVPECE